jgi:hypothetical protein
MRLAAGRDGAAQRPEPLELVRVVRVVELAAVRHVERPEPQPLDRDPERPRLERQRAVVERLAEPGHVVEALTHVLDRQARRERDAVPLVRAVGDDVVAGLLELLVRELVGLALDLLHREHVDVGVLEVVDHPALAGAD